MLKYVIINLNKTMTQPLLHKDCQTKFSPYKVYYVEGLGGNTHIPSALVMHNKTC
jgi:hypothetical protein